MQCLFHAILAANLEKEKLKKRTSDAVPGVTLHGTQNSLPLASGGHEKTALRHTNQILIGISILALWLLRTRSFCFCSCRNLRVCRLFIQA